MCSPFPFVKQNLVRVGTQGGVSSAMPKMSSRICRGMAPILPVGAIRFPWPVAARRLLANPVTVRGEKRDTASEFSCVSGCPKHQFEQKRCRSMCATMWLCEVWSHDGCPRENCGCTSWLFAEIKKIILFTVDNTGFNIFFRHLYWWRRYTEIIWILNKIWLNLNKNIAKFVKKENRLQ